MVRFTNPLAKVKVASPCHAEWEKMIGSHRVRFCAQCNLNVYNLSEMTRAQAESLIVEKEGRLCVRYYRRRDGSIITRDCPVGLQAIRRRVSYALKAIAAAAFTFLSVIGLQGLAPGSLRLNPKPVTGRLVVRPPDFELVQGAMPADRPILGKLSPVRSPKKTHPGK